MNRVCGSCTLCCKLLPVHDNWVVPPMHKGGGERCRHQFSGGCRVYRQPSLFPACCGLWSCRWLNGDAEHVKRPDRSHYVIDALPDKLVIEDHVTGQQTGMPALQVWVDPAFKDAWQDPDLLAYIEAKGMAALLRWNSKDADVLVPPALTASGKWEVVSSNLIQKFPLTP
jgi:hypothetical protein